MVCLYLRVVFILCSINHSIVIKLEMPVLCCRPTSHLMSIAFTLLINYSWAVCWIHFLCFWSVGIKRTKNQCYLNLTESVISFTDIECCLQYKLSETIIWRRIGRLLTTGRFQSIGLCYVLHYYCFVYSTIIYIYCILTRSSIN